MSSTLTRYYNIACAQKTCRACQHFVTEILTLDFDVDPKAQQKYSRMMRATKRHVIEKHIDN